MHQDSQVEAWLHPVQGRFTAAHWRLLLGTSDAALLQLALYCAVRGDCDSLTSLCEEILVDGRAPDFIAQNFCPVMSEPVPVCKPDGSVVTERRHFTAMGLHDIIALCLARPAHADGVIRPADTLQTTADPEQLSAVAHQATLHPRQSRLLHRSIEVFRLPGQRSWQNDGVRRLFTAVTSRVGFPGILDEFALQGVDVLALVRGPVLTKSDLKQTSHPLYCHVLRQRNPVVALAMVDLVQQASLQRTDSQDGIDCSALFSAVVDWHGQRPGRSLLWALDSLRREVGDDHLETDPRFHAIVRLCLYAMGTDVHEMLVSCLSIVSEHLAMPERTQEAVDPLDWCEPFVRAMAVPLMQLGPERLAMAVQGMIQEHRGTAELGLAPVLCTYCTPMITALAPVMGAILDGELFPAHAWKGWTLLSKPRRWFAASSLEHWQETLQTLQQLGLDPMGMIALKRLNKQTGQPYETRTSLLHMFASGADDGLGAPARACVLDQMLVLLQMGADARAQDSDGLTPMDRFEDPALARRWESMANSHLASTAARLAIEDLTPGS